MIDTSTEQVRRLWREVGSMSFVANHFGWSKSAVCMACFGFPSPQAWRAAQDAAAFTAKGPT